MTRSRTTSMISHKTMENIGDYAVFDPVEYRAQRGQLSQHRCTRLSISSLIVLALGFHIGGIFAQQMEREIVRDDSISSEMITNIYFYDVVVKDTHPLHVPSQTYSLSTCSTRLHQQYYGALGVGIVVMILLIICFIVSILGFNGNRFGDRPFIFFLPALLGVILVMDIIILSLAASPLQWDNVCPGVGGTGIFRLGGGAGTFIASIFFTICVIVLSLWHPSPGNGYKLDTIYISPSRLEEMKLENKDHGSDPIFSDKPTATSYRFVPASRAISGVSSSAVLVRDENAVRSSTVSRTSVYTTAEGLEKDRRTCYKDDLRRAYLPPLIEEDDENDFSLEA